MLEGLCLVVFLKAKGAGALYYSRAGCRYNPRSEHLRQLGELGAELPGLQPVNFSLLESWKA